MVSVVWWALIIFCGVQDCFLSIFIYTIIDASYARTRSKTILLKMNFDELVNMQNVLFAYGIMRHR